ncbi:FtsX-like permease family protein [Candidatus Microgenomates bacterium]|nr:FtsX-like permease family protein [Candidatus Microgenomates bacterium]
MKSAFNATWRHIRRSPYQAAAAIITMTSTFLVVMMFALIFLGSTLLLSHLESLPQVTAFFRDEAKQENIDALKQQLEASGKAASFKFVSKDEALNIYREQNKNDKLLLELVTAEILPASLEVSALKVGDLPELAEIMKQSSIVEDVVFARDVVDKLAKFIEGTRVITTALAILLFVSLVFTTLFIISLRVFVHKDEIETMRLLGAGRWKIFWPFLLEGIFYGVFSATFSGIVSFFVTPLVASFYQDIFLGVLTLPIPVVVYLIVVGSGILLGILASFIGGYIAVNRYIKA